MPSGTLSIGDYFTSTTGFALQRTKKGEPVLTAEYGFPTVGEHDIAVRVQDDLGGEAILRETVFGVLMRNAFLPYEKRFAVWVSDGFPDVQDATAEFLDQVLDETSERPLWPGQRDGLLRTIYAFEILGKRNLLLNIVTGGGKTAIIAACIAWLRWVYDVRSFLILCPNTIVRERLRADFEAAKVFHDFELLPGVHSHYLKDLGLHVLEPGAATQGMLESGIVLGNIQQLYGKGSNERLAFVLNFLGDLAVFNDEAHNTPASEYTDVLRTLGKKQVFRLDTTATPDRADGQAAGLGDGLRIRHPSRSR